MHTVHHVNYPFLDTMRHSNSGNSLDFEKINFNWDHPKRQLILSIETYSKIGYEVKAVLKGNRLMFEAPLLLSFNKPFRTHLIETETRQEFEDGFTVIGYSEIRLNHGYKYQLISCQVIDTKKIRVILDYHKWGRYEVS